MSLEDQFSSIQLDRDEIDRDKNSNHDDDKPSTIAEEDALSESQTRTEHEQSASAIDPTTEFNSEAQIQGIDGENGNVGSPNFDSDNANSESVGQSKGSNESAGTTVVNRSKSGSSSDQNASEPGPSPIVQGSSSTTSAVSGANRISSQATITPSEQERTVMFEKYRIESSVTSPINDLDTASKHFISYLVTTTTNHPAVVKLSSHRSAPEDEYVTISVRRRYGDFSLLHECLSNDIPTAMIPPLPSKSNFKYLTGDTFSTEFVNKRLHSLDRFMKFILQHKRLSQESVFHLFISDSNDWGNFTKNLKLRDINYDESGAGSSANGFVNKVVNEDMITEKVMNYFTSSKHKRETNKDILEINDKLKKIYENLMKLDKIFVRLNKKNHDLSIDYDQFSAQIMKLSLVQTTDMNSTSEPSTPSKNGDAASVVDSNITNNFKIFADSLDYLSKNWSELHKYVDETFLVSLRDCSKYIISLSNLIEFQHNKKIDLQVLQDYLAKARSELASFGGSTASTGARHPPPVPVLNSHSGGGIVNNTTQLIKDTLSTSATPHIGSTATDGKIGRLEERINKLESEITVQTKLVNDLTYRIINEEYPNWDKFNRNQLKESMVGLCDQEIKFYKGLVDNWSDVETKLLRRLDELK
ncbi:hypothetical protein G9P44_001029 [Scheffersomyces stipitis]|nr:hypothetical protein G9P44_001029 [Scheffersomyces stipitis]